MYSGESGSRMRRAGRPRSIGPARRLNSGRKADWLPLVRAMLRAVTFQPTSRWRSPARAAAKSRSPSGPPYKPMARSNAPARRSNDSM